MGKPKRSATTGKVNEMELCYERQHADNPIVRKRRKDIFENGLRLGEKGKTIKSFRRIE